MEGGFYFRKRATAECDNPLDLMVGARGTIEVKS